jgi:hypothetical protein
VRKVLIVAAFSLLALALSAVALASPSALLDQYSGLAGEVQRGVPTGTQAVHSQGTLPFTGLDLALIAGGGLLLVLTGWTLRRTGRGKA